jgi:cytochrome b involved in lipid metabolism
VIFSNRGFNTTNLSPDIFHLHSTPLHPPNDTLPIRLLITTQDHTSQQSHITLITPPSSTNTMADKEFTYSDVSEHATKKDLFVVIHDKVYNTSSFVDEHP